MTDIICHIVGMNNKIKEEFIKLCNEKYPDVVIEDLDVITNNIRLSYEMTILLDSLKRAHKNSKSKSNIMKNINNLWKEQINLKLDKIYKKNKDKKIIFLGLCTFHRNNKIKVCIDTKCKFFLKMKATKNARDSIEYNLKKYEKDIINGNFPLKYLDYNFLVEQRNKISNIYENIGYKQNTYKKILNLLDKMLINNNIIYISNNSNNSSKKIRKRKQDVKQILNEIGSEQSYEKYTGYNEKWLSVLSSINNYKKHFKKGYLGKGLNQTRFIEERYPNAIDMLDTDTYIYNFDNTNFKKINWYKYTNTNTLFFENSEYINNIYDYMNNNNIKIIKYNQN